jgi:hypothetical protein
MTDGEMDFKALHLDGFKGLWKVYGGWSFLTDKSFIISFLLTATVCLIIAGCNLPASQTYALLIDNINVGLALDGGLIGVTLAGLTLIVTFGSETLMRNLVRVNLKEALDEGRVPGFSIYQKAVSKFTFAVIVQILTLILLFFIKIISGLKMSFTSDCYNQVVNILAIFMCLFLLFFSLFLLVQMTLNIFTISQMNHAVFFEDEAGKLE